MAARGAVIATSVLHQGRHSDLNSRAREIPHVLMDAETRPPPKVGPRTKPLGSGVSRRRRGRPRFSFFALYDSAGRAPDLTAKADRLNAD